MSFYWDLEPVVAPSDFDPFTRQVARPASTHVSSEAPRPRLAPAKRARPAHVDLILRNLLDGRLPDEPACGRAREAPSPTGAAIENAPTNPSGDDVLPDTTKPDRGAAAELAALDRRLARLERQIEQLGAVVGTADQRQATRLQAQMVTMLEAVSQMLSHGGIRGGAPDTSSERRSSRAHLR